MTYQMEREEMAMIQDILRIVGNNTEYIDGDPVLALARDQQGELCRLVEELRRKIQ